MRTTVVYVLILTFLLPSCSGRSSGVRVVKPKYHHRWFDRKKDKKTKRTKIVTFKR